MASTLMKKRVDVSDDILTPEPAAELRSSLDAFLVDNPELEALNARLGPPLGQPCSWLDLPA